MQVITLIGADASGKDTQIALLKNELKNQNKKVQVITIWDSLADFGDIQDKKTLQDIVETFLLKYQGHARSFFLLACLKNSISKIDTSNDIVILNGFFHKYWASELTYGVDNLLWEKNTKEFIKSDKIFYLKTPVEICLERKITWSKYEQGMGKFLDKSKNTDKASFQKKMHENLDRIAGKIEKLVTIDGSQTIESVFNTIKKAL